METQKFTVQMVPDLDRPICYLEQAVGSGKTGLLVARIKSRDTDNHIFVAPTIDLGKEIKQRLDKAGARNVHHLYHSQPSRESVLKKALWHINGRPPAERHVLILTTETFRTLLEELSPVLAAHYHLYLDEGMQAVEHVQLQADRIDQYAELLATDQEGVLIPAPGQTELLRDVATRDDRVSKRGKENLLTKKFVEIAGLVSGDLYDVRGTISERAISVVALLRPHKFMHFKSVTMVEALWSQSILAMTWERRYGVIIRPLCPDDYPLFDTHREKGPLMDLYYCLHPGDRATQKNLQRDFVTGAISTNVAASRRVVTQIAKEVHEFFESRDLRYCWNANRKFRNLAGVLNDHQMPAVSAGLNTWIDIDNVVALVCINPPSWVKNLLLAFLGIDPSDLSEVESVYRRWRFAHTYQTVGRCSLRDRDCMRRNIIVVLSRQCAEDIAACFPGATIKGCITGLPCYKSMDTDVRREGKVQFDASDHKAWSMWKKRHPDGGITKPEWYKNIRVFRKLSNLDALAA